jgi:predicted AAA+ superfamily ATPase
MIINRQITPKLLSLAAQFPVVAVVGPRQSGKTTLVKSIFSNHIYVTLEDLDIKLRAIEDPRKFFAAYDNPHGIIIDEIQEAPDLLSYMQGIVDTAYRPGYFILTGSQNFLIHEKISQTLAGRIALLTLLPLTVDELATAGLLPGSVEELICKGLYPRVYAQPINPVDWFIFYISTYVERDIRSVLNITDIVAFQRFIKLCAGRVGQLLNYTALASDCGISLNTAKAWISILEASYIIHLVQPYYKNFNKRVIKTPKLYFHDVGLVCSLLEIKSAQQLHAHYFRGSIFENFVISELMKHRFNKGNRPNMFFWRDVQGHEIDCILEQADKLVPIEIKSGMTVSTNFFDGLVDWNTITKQGDVQGYVVYGGAENQKRKHAEVISWHNIKTITEALDK